LRSEIAISKKKQGENTVKLFVEVRIALFLGVVLAPASVLFAQTKAPSKPAPISYKATIEGLVRDVACPMQNHASTSTDFNLKCALECAKAGSPLIILTKSGDIYFPMSDVMPDPSQREKMMPFVGKQVRATGVVYRRNGTRTIVIKEMVELKGVKVNASLGDD
jgi:hypothetical protein